ncbi:MAG: exonuclease SbcCD subunit D [Aeromicrobium sp.]
MRILHTSDWHVGRTFHGHSTLAALDEVFEAVVGVVRDRQVDVVLVSGDVYDSSTPSAEAVDLLNSILLRLREAGAVVVVTSGNHDSPARLGTMSAFAAAAGVHVVTTPEQITRPVTLTDEHGPVHVYGMPFLEPARLRHVWSDAPMRSQKDVVGRAMQLVRDDLATRAGRSVVLAHTFVQGADGESCDSERDIVGPAVGGVDKVPVPTFDGVDYAALGHIHGRARLSGHVRYSGAPLHYSFSEAGKPRGGWLVDLDAGGLADVAWVDLPVPRPLTVVTGTLDDLLVDTALDAVADHWVSAVLTDTTRPMDAMRRLQTRFAHCAHLEFRPSRVHDDGGRSYAELVRGKTDDQLVDTFLTKVRNGEGSTDLESTLVRDVIAEREASRSA